MIRRAFSLVELLVVAAIIAVLIGLLLPMVRMIKVRAKDAATIVRMEAILKELSRLGTEEGLLSHGLMVAAGLPGVKLMRVDAQLRPMPETDPGTLAAAGIATNDWLSYDRPHHFAFPWGQAIAADADGLYDDPPLRRSLDDLSPERSPALLAAAGVLPADDPDTADDESAAAYRERRGADLPWNDAWGAPLVVAYGVYQADGRDPDRGELLRALRRYQYNRAIYLSVASTGPTWAQGTSAGDWEATLAQQWSLATEACNRSDDGAPLWDERAMADPPWTGVRVVGSGSVRRYLSAPVECK